MAYGRTTARLTSIGANGILAQHQLVVEHPTASFRKIGHILNYLEWVVKSFGFCGLYHTPETRSRHWPPGRFGIGHLANLFRLWPKTEQHDQPDQGHQPILDQYLAIEPALKLLIG